MGRLGFWGISTPIRDTKARLYYTSCQCGVWWSSGLAYTRCGFAGIILI